MGILYEIDSTNFLGVYYWFAKNTKNAGIWSMNQNILRFMFKEINTTGNLLQPLR